MIDLPDLAIAMGISALPFFELRGGLPYALLKGIDPVVAVIATVAANALIVPIVFLFLDYVHHHLLPIRWYARLFDRFVERTRKKIHSDVERYGYLGLAIFVAIPLPMTGAYTGALGSWIFGMDKKKAFLAIAAGVAAAGIIVALVVLSGSVLLRTIFHL